MLARDPHTLEEAMEALTTFAEMDERADLYELTHDLKEDEAHQGVMDWLTDFDPEHAVQMIRRLFRIVLDHARQISGELRTGSERERMAQGLNMMMAIAGEAARRLDHIAVLVYGMSEGSITHLKEYRELRSFYLKNIVKETREIRKGKRPLRDQRIEEATVDFDEVKGDTDYELLYLQKGPGQDFLSPGLAQNIRLAVDFGSSLEFVEGDPLIHVQSWFDGVQQRAAEVLVKGTSQQLSTFFQRAGAGLESPLCSALKNATTALMLAANADNRLPNGPVKACFQYFADFQHFLRGILESREYQRLVAYPPTEGESWLYAAHELIGTLLYHLYTQVELHQEMLGVVGQIIRSGPAHAGRGYQRGHVAEQLFEDYEAVEIALSRHPSGPLFKAVDLLREEEERTLDLLEQGNIPYKICDLEVEEKKVALLRVPSPTRQEFIQNALVNEEFKGFFRHNWREAFVMLSYEDRLSWKGQARALVLEHLQEIDPAKGLLHVVTLSKDSEFYHQRGLYKEHEVASVFLEHFAHQLASSRGYHFSEVMRELLFPEFVPAMLQTVHTLFFEGKERLSRAERLDFIEIAYLFLELKILDLIRPRHFSFTCKDGVDTSMGASAALYAGLKILLEHEWEIGDRAKLWSMVFVPSLLFRERAMQKGRFERLHSCLRRLEGAVTHHSAGGTRHLLHEQLAPLYEFDLFSTLTH
ncbi:MAG: hypothetical protein AB7F31_03460 [Parachlamydiales bacterium]